MTCGAESFTEMEEFGKAKRDWLSNFLDLSSGIESHNTFNKQRLRAVGPGSVRAVSAELDSIAVSGDTRSDSASGREDASWFLRAVVLEGGDCYGDGGGDGESSFAGEPGGRGEMPRNQGDSAASGADRHQRGAGDHRRDGLPQSACEEGGGLCAGGEEKPAKVVRGGDVGLF